ncbi:hypothetical protein K438DRAFT_1775955 [Mycena galopus ATCC 62051]|nr:hypothetical protein K438DRAFT_1775955 [Mycena galopus ATCC 62051]
MTKQAKKDKTIYKSYSPDDVPEVMPFPELSKVVTTKGDQMAVPKLWEYQHIWIHDKIRGVDLHALTKKAAFELYDKVKDEVFKSEAFQHKVQPGDAAEEARLPSLMADWKQKQKSRKKGKGKGKGKDATGDTADTDDDDIDHEEEDTDGRIGAIQKVISNKRPASKNKQKATNDDSPARSAPDAAALATLMGITSYTGRDEFRDDRHDAIEEYSLTLTGDVNAGAKFRQAEALLRQKLVTRGFKHLVHKLHASRKFRPMVATMLMAWLNEDGQVELEWQVLRLTSMASRTYIWSRTEAIPDDIRMGQPSPMDPTEHPLTSGGSGCFAYDAIKAVIKAARKSQYL